MSTSVSATHVSRQNPDSTIYHLPAEIRLMILRWILVCAPLHDIVLAFDSRDPFYGDDYKNRLQTPGGIKGHPVHGHLVCHTTLLMHCHCNPSRPSYICVRADVLRVCRRFYNEGIQMLYGENNFVFENFIELNLNFLTRIGLSNTERLRSVRIYDPLNCEVPIDLKLPLLNWYSLKNLQKVEFIFPWNKAISSRRKAGSQNLHPYLRWCETVESNFRKLASQLHRMHRVECETIEAWVAAWGEYEPSTPEFEVAVKFHVKPGEEVCRSSLSLEQANAAFWDDVQTAVRLRQSGGWAEGTISRFRDTSDLLRELLVSYWAHILCHEKREVHKDVFKDTKSFAAELARMSMCYIDYHPWEMISNIFVVSLEPTWKDG
ncbi:MAG: hypothetical protein M1824_006391 [Vezdaea acicularis]|nr:MAG: hypothetical protein M1824_006391 [Vezdaea acicularis]